jgi:hypothetical protein
MVLRSGTGFYLTSADGAADCVEGRYINTTTGGYLSNGGDWINASDRNAKENFKEVDARQLLEKIASLPVTEWNYIGEDENVRHIGPVAQDFNALFGVGQDDISISTVDPAGIALAAIKELHRKTQRIDAQQQEIDDLRSQLAELKKTVESLSVSND